MLVSVTLGLKHALVFTLGRLAAYCRGGAHEAGAGHA